MDIQDRIDVAIDRVTHGRAVMSFPVNIETDVDCVLSDCAKEIDQLRARVAELELDNWKLAEEVGRTDVRIKSAGIHERRRITELEAENALLMSELSAGTGHSHRCKRCNLDYTPGKNESENCPECEYDGK